MRNGEIQLVVSEKMRLFRKTLWIHLRYKRMISKKNKKIKGLYEWHTSNGIWKSEAVESALWSSIFEARPSSFSVSSPFTFSTMVSSHSTFFTGRDFDAGMAASLPAFCDEMSNQLDASFRTDLMA